MYEMPMNVSEEYVIIHSFGLFSGFPLSVQSLLQTIDSKSRSPSSSSSALLLLPPSSIGTFPPGNARYILSDYMLTSSPGPRHLAPWILLRHQGTGISKLPGHWLLRLPPEHVTLPFYERPPLDHGN
ncbi:hypothetical protein AB205_0211220 [Aquarana catesbeiana]|uniref:Uncharacterized protein n=1 Tax=Aquarana catesbeiana TaxID=8400 RepID=A0A2G9SCS2_AQUCT|nr:hypothetical protein AB205_0211220 [Aquarana catesbeiana]